MKEKSLWSGFALVFICFFVSVSKVSAADTNTLSISPFHLLLPVVELTLESDIAKDMSLTGILGYGWITDTDINGSRTKVNIFEAGAQYRYYPSGDTHKGMHLGLEGLYVRPSFNDNSIKVKGSGFALGPFVGYKWAPDSGEVYDLQIGYQRMIAKVEAKDDVGNQAEASSTDGFVLFNFNIGFRF